MSSLKRAPRAAPAATPSAISYSWSVPPSLTATNKTERKKNALLPRSFRATPIAISHGEGHELVTKDGRRLFDISCGAAVTCFGPGRVDRIWNAANRQRDLLAYHCSAYCEADIAIEYANALVASTNGTMEWAICYGSGTEANEAAAKISLQYHNENGEPSRNLFIGRHQSYHGTTFTTLAIGHHAVRRHPFESSLSSNMTHVKACNAYRGKKEGQSDEDYVGELKEELEKEFQRLGPENVAAVFIEPVVGAALGCAPAVPGYLKAMREVCTAHGAHLIFDEIMCGMGRCGYLHASEMEGVVPDIQTLGKGLAAGAEAFSAMLVGKKIGLAIDRGSAVFMHGHTNQNWLPGCAAGLEALSMIRECIPNIRKQGALLKESLKVQLGSHAHVGDIRGMGLFLGLEFVRNKATKEPFERADHIAERIRAMGTTDPYRIFTYPGTGSADGFKGDHLIIAPPFNVTEDQIKYIVKQVTALIKDFFATMQPIEESF
ncbi:aminotransferase-like protein [Massarina eburnea CBS 473.64]|uniref:Aminotransferase-like protein n=1 Tax=Massarina eburnea CBS 473.64 TaxID=1395130 RepID=A0A6A6S4V0_9PLEO|nr:aminotransferase-like protein [Massarina eburnea CBS 473.64]